MCFEVSLNTWSAMLSSEVYSAVFQNFLAIITFLILLFLYSLNPTANQWLFPRFTEPTPLLLIVTVQAIEPSFPDSNPLPNGVDCTYHVSELFYFWSTLRMHSHVFSSSFILILISSILFPLDPFYYVL